MASTIAVMAVIGLAIGLFAGLVGVGGGSLMIPVFRLIASMEPVAATATSLFVIIPTSLAGTISHLRNRTCVPKLGVVMGLAGACTSPVGVWLAQLSPGWLVMLGSALAIAYSAFRTLRKSLAEKKGSGALEAPKLSRTDYLHGAVIGLIAGAISGYIGLGGGFLMIPLMLVLLDFPMKLASGTSLVAIMILAIPGAITQGLIGNIDYVAGIAIAAGSIPGALVGGKLTKRVNNRALGIVFSCFLGVAAVLLIVNELSVLG